MDYTKICFVIMPFGEKGVCDEDGKTKTVNFDTIFDKVFHEAIRDVTLPEGGHLEPRRTDKDFFSGDIGQEMFEYLEYSRIALTDITGLNPNVFYELGVRHRARQAGTVIFRQLNAKIPFDINQIKAFPYEYEPEVQFRESVKLISRVVTESLQQIRLDSPVQKALLVQRNDRAYIESDLRDAENALRVGDRARAIGSYKKALTGDPGNNLLQLRLGLLLKDEGRWEDAMDHFTKAIIAAPTYSEAYREKGIAENKLYWKAKDPTNLPDGIENLRKSIELNQEDYDAHASLAGALKRAQRIEESLAEYERSVEVSRGHSYPLLNAIKLKAQITGKLEIDDKMQFQINRAERSLRAQIASEPPYDPPWSFFDLAEVRLYKDDMDGFLSLARRGIDHATHKWQADTFADSLQALLDAGVNLAGLREGLDAIRKRASLLPD